MCSTHNPKKHYFSIRQKICIRFTFVNQDSMCRSFMIDIAQFQQQGCLSIVNTILHLETKGFNVQKYKITLPQFENMEINLQKNILIPYERIPKKEFFLHLQKKDGQQSHEQQQKKTKQPERYIGQVIQKVKHWRQLFDEKKMSLKQAAIVVNVAKKSLDDYFLLLRQGQILGFQFDKKLNSKMGQLRAFIKLNSKKLPCGKLPLQMIHDFHDLNELPIKTNDQNHLFQFQQMKQSLKLHSIDLDDDCDYACTNQGDSD